jgi:hypothetical protein
VGEGDRSAEEGAYDGILRGLGTWWVTVGKNMNIPSSIIEASTTHKCR